MIRYYNLKQPKCIGYYIIAKFNEYNTYTPEVKLSNGSKLSSNLPQSRDMNITTLRVIDHPYSDSQTQSFRTRLLSFEKAIGLDIRYCEHYIMPFIFNSQPSSSY